MRKPLLFTFLLAATVSNAQMTSSNEPAIGETVDLFVLDSNATDYAGVTGSGVTWDYSATGGYAGAYETVEVLDPSGETYVDSFPGATKVISVGSIKTYFSSTANDRTSQGFHMNEASLGDVLGMYGNDQQHQLNYPFGYGTAEVTDTYDGNLSLTFNGFPVYESLTGTSHNMIDGEGTLLFPDGSSASVIRLYSSDTAATTLPILGAVDVIKNQYEYYDYSASNLPVFIHVHSVIVQSGGSQPISEISLVLSKYAGSDVNVDEISEVNFSIAPNPTENIVRVTGDFTANASAQLTDQSGRVLSTTTIQNGQTIDVSTLSAGMYLLTISDNGITTTKTILKK